jgi:hypothetical protein
MNDYKVDEQEALRLAEKGKLIIEARAFWNSMKEEADFVTYIEAYAREENERNKPWIIQEINKWKRWIKGKQ